MQYQSTHTCLAWTDALTAAVYFDRVIPASIPDTYPVATADPIYFEVLQQLLPESLLDPGAKTGVAHPVIQYVTHFLMTFPQAAGVRELREGETLEDRQQSGMPGLLSAFSNLVQQSAVADIALYGIPTKPGSQAADGDPALVLSNLDLVDTSRLSWRQVIELRKDSDSVERLRNLRRMVYRDYAGKPEAYIREDIEQRLSEYEAAARLWGFPLKKGLLEIAMTGDALAAAGAGIALTLFGAPIAVVAAAGGAIAVGKAALTIAQRKHDIELERKRTPMAYLVKLKQLAEKA
jgi:hypothetical protein